MLLVLLNFDDSSLEQEKSELEEALGVKSSRQIFYRGFMLNESDFGTSPDYERSSPNFEEKYVLECLLVHCG